VDGGRRSGCGGVAPRGTPEEDEEEHEQLHQETTLNYKDVFKTSFRRCLTYADDVLTI
jgi:hypothetical protein